MASSPTSVTDTEPSDQRRSGEGHLHSARSCSHRTGFVATGFEQIVSPDADDYAGKPQLTTLRGLLTIVAIHGNSVAF